MTSLKFHWPLGLILILHLVIGATYSAVNPLGEAPDEPAHFLYARFIAENGRLPATLEERRDAGYRSSWPPLFHSLIAIPIRLLDGVPPTHLKSVGDSVRRLIPTNGQTIASFIHTNDESWPWRGISLAWHIGRLIAVLLMNLSIIVMYIISWRLTQQRRLALLCAATYAFLPQVFFIGAATNDDNLLILISSLVMLTLITYALHPAVVGLGRFFMLGLLLGLATVAKYNAIPLWPLVFLSTIWLTRQTALHLEQKWSLWRVLLALVAVGIGAIITCGWWFGFVWINFNQLGNYNLFRGLLATFSANTSDAALREVIGENTSINFFSLWRWLEWSNSFFKTFWGMFGGGGTIALPWWLYWLFAAIALLAVVGLFRAFRTDRLVIRQLSPTELLRTRLQTLYLFLLTPLFFLPLPITRFMLTDKIVETTQGRHLYPALTAIILGLVWGLNSYLLETRATTPVTSLLDRTPRWPHLLLLLPALLLGVSLYGPYLINASFPPLIPLTTHRAAITITNPLEAKVANGVTLIGVALSHPQHHALPVTLWWQATTVPTQDYVTELILTDNTGQIVGSWIGQPLGGRYPTRAWDKGDILRDDILLPLLPDLAESQANLTLQVLDTARQPAGQALTLAQNIALPAFSEEDVPLPGQLRADGYDPDAGFNYRATLSFILPDGNDAQLIAPDGQVFNPAQQTVGTNGSLAHFMVEANWPSGRYQTPLAAYQPLIVNRPRRFEAPASQILLDANFADMVTLLGVDLPQRRVQPGQTFPITMTLQANRTMGQHLAIFNHLLDHTATQRGGADRIPQEYYTTLLWVPGEVVIDAYRVPVDYNAPPGIYWLDVGLYPTQRPEFSLPLMVDGQPLDRNSVSIGPIKVGGPPAGTTMATANPEYVTEFSFGDQIALLGFDLTGTGDSILTQTLTLYWQPGQQPQADYTVFVHLVDEHGNVAGQVDGPPARGTYPTSLWDISEIIVDSRSIPQLPAGKYGLFVGLYQPESGQRLPVTGAADGAVLLVTFEVED